MVPLPAASNATPRQVHALDVLIVVWTLAWIAVGILVAIEVYHLGRLSDTLANAAGALHQTSQGLAAFTHIPFVGGSIARIAGQVGATANSASANAAASKSSVDQLAYLLGIVIVVIPAVPALAVYLPFRVGRAREGRTVRRALDGTDTDALRRYLANRALVNLPYHQLQVISSDPWEDMEQGRLDALAGAELARLGFDRHRLDAGSAGVDL